MNHLIQFQDTVYKYRRRDKRHEFFTLGPLSFGITKGDVVAILGPSGSGKTTLLRLIAGLEFPVSGTIGINGKTVAGPRISVRPEDRKVGMVFQDYALFPHLTVKENILFGIRRWPIDDQKKRLTELEVLLNLHQNYEHRYPHQLSGGQQQRVALARTLAPKPSVILLDEPLSNIDADLRGQVAQELRRVLKSSMTTAVMVTHDQEEAFDVADRVIVLNDGKLEQMDTPQELYHHPRTRFVADFVGLASFIPSRVKGSQLFTELGQFPFNGAHSQEDTLELMVRPQEIHAQPDASGEATVIQQRFRGAQQYYTVKLSSGRTLLLTQSSNTTWTPGTKLKLSLQLRNIITFPAQCPIVPL